MDVPSSPPALDGSHPVAIVGAGPAGCAAAIALGRAGIDALLLERGAPGKDKPCGDAFVPTAVTLLDVLGIDTACLAALGGVPFTRIDLYYQASCFLSQSAGDGIGWIVPRASLDQKLRDVAARCASICYHAGVTGITRDNGGRWKLTIRQETATSHIFCDTVILACGSGSALAGQWGISGEPILGASITGYGGREAVEAPIFEFTEAFQPGYGWVFPISADRVNIGVCALTPAAVKGLRRHAEAYPAQWGIEQSCRWRGGGEALWSGMGRTWHHDAGMISCGDAAGLVHPGSAEGITGALLSGMHAGEAMSMYLHDRRDARPLAEYSAWVGDHFGRAYERTPERRLWDGLCGL